MADGQDNDPVQSQANDEQDNAKNPQLNQHGVGNGTSPMPRMTPAVSVTKPAQTNLELQI
jgi:hypothetical protein